VSIIHVPKLSLVALIGATGSGKSSFARKHFKPTEIVSSDFYRGLVSDDETSLEASGDAFELLYHTIHIRLRRGLLTVIDATHVREEDRAKVIAIAREHDVFAIAIVLALPEQVCVDRNALRPDRQFGRHVIAGHCRNVQRSIPHLERERFRSVHVLRSQEAVDAVTIERQPAWSDKTEDHGPFDIIGDVHGCYEELIELLTALGYDTLKPERITSPVGRKAVFVGDLVDRGPHSVRVLETVMSMVHRGVALCVAGNHDVKLLKALAGRKVKLSHGLEETMKNSSSRSATSDARSYGSFLMLASVTTSSTAESSSLRTPA
jgi:protein phosphatase